MINEAFIAEIFLSVGFLNICLFDANNRQALICGHVNDLHVNKTITNTKYTNV